MKLLFDQLMSKDPQTATPENKKILDTLDKAVVMNIDNVAEYYFLHEQDEWDLVEDIKCAAPPFDIFFAEYKSPEYVYSKTKGFELFPLPGRFGTLFYTEQNEDKGWSLYSWFFFDVHGYPEQWDGMCIMHVDSTGRIIKYSNGAPFVFIGLGPEFSEMNKDALVGTIAMCYLFPPLLAVTFMNCPEVEIVKRGKGTNKGGRSRHGPRFTYHELNIRPLKKILEDEGDIMHNGLKKALHICRGHFKRYESKGLFGKYQGVFWWHHHVRGELSRGIVEKDYRVLPK